MSSDSVNPVPNYPELQRVLKNLLELQEKLLLSNAETTEVVSQNNKLLATVSLDNGCVRARIDVRFSKDDQNEVTYNLRDYPLIEFQAILSLICPLLPKLKFLSENPEYLTAQFTKDAIQDLRRCADILTIRTYLTNSEFLSDWNTSFEPILDPLKPITIFPFRASIYVTAFQLEETSEPEPDVVQIFHSDISPFNLSSKSIIRIGAKYYSIKHSVVASQKLQILAEIIQCIQESINELTTLHGLRTTIKKYEK